MWWKLTRSQFARQQGPGNRRAFRRLVTSGEPPGLLAYHRGTPVGWCAVAPREAYPALERSRVLGRIDDQAVWSVVCFFVARPFRRQGLTVALLRAAIAYAKRRGAALVEGYPVAPRSGKMPDAFAYTGLVPAFREAGFVEVSRRSPTRPIMRCALSG